MVLTAGLDYAAWSPADRNFDSNADVLLLRTQGDLASVYDIGDLAYVGGGFVPDYQGHNVVEPAAAGVATVIGADYAAFQGVVDPLLAQGGIVVAQSFRDLKRIIGELQSSPAARRQIVQSASALLRTFTSTEPLEATLLRKALQQVQT